MSASLVWFRADLRCHDNPALFEACQAATTRDETVIAVFLVTPKQWLEHGQGGNQVQFLLRNLASLNQQLNRLNIPLKFIEAADFLEVPQKLADFCAQHQINHVYCNQQYEWNERQRDTAVEQRLNESAISFHSYIDQVIFSPGQILTGKGDYYTVFTPFYRNWISQLRAEPLQPLPCPEPLQQEAGSSDLLPELADFPVQAEQLQELWPAGEAAALQGLQEFCKKGLKNYASQRDWPALKGTSGLSAWLALGVLSPRQCLAAALQASEGRITDKNTGAGVWVSELIWREFYRHILVGFPRVSRGKAFKPDTEKLAWRSLDNPQVQQQFQAWKEGRTGFPLVDAAMRQLNQTGWMHNRLRMLTAMFLSKHLLIDWRVGEAYFAEKLVDWDLAANNGGWQWAASTGTDAVPYFRLFNPYSQSKRFDPDGDFIRCWVPELKHLSNKQIHQPLVDKTDLFAASNYPQPIIELKAARERVMQAFKAIKN
jgi:deoxyribodipyrimidine photo-lyase